MIKLEDRYLQRIVKTHCFVTSIYIPATIVFLMYSDKLYNIGHYSSYWLLLGLILAEYTKYCVTYFADGGNPKKNKQQKSDVKIKTIKCLIVVGMIFVYYFIAVLFGAPAFEEQEQTFMFSCLLSVLTTVPASFNLSADRMLKIFTELTMFQSDLMAEVILRTIQFTLVGAWLGAFVIPLDWDRPWQKWPIPCSLGALGGYFLAHVFSLCSVILRSYKVFGKKTGKYGL